MSNDDDMRLKMAAIGARYLARTVAEIDDLQKMTARLHAGERTALKDIEVLAHRIHGSGAVFGFTKLSDAAGVIEMLAVANASIAPLDAAQLSEQFTVHIRRLAAETQSATTTVQIT